MLEYDNRTSVGEICDFSLSIDCPYWDDVSWNDFVWQRVKINWSRLELMQPLIRRPDTTIKDTGLTALGLPAIVTILRTIKKTR